MPSPLPGMDPFLEGDDWRSVHTHLSVEIARHLAPRLQPKYFVCAERNYILEISDSDSERPSRRIPDVAAMPFPTDTPASSTAVLTLQAPLTRSIPESDEETQVVVHIYDAMDRALVTAIEVLPATNKHRAGRAEHLAKRAKYLRSEAHLMEIDLQSILTTMYETFGYDLELDYAKTTEPFVEHR